MSTATSTDIFFFDNKDSDIFSSAIDQSQTNFFDAFLNDDSDAFDSSGASNDSSIFDAVDLGFYTSQSSESSFIDPPASEPKEDQYQALHTWRASPWFQHKFDRTAPASRKLVHHMRQDGQAISGMELLSLEGITSRNQTSTAQILSSPSASSKAPAPRNTNRDSFRRNNDSKVSKSQAHSSLDPAKMMRPSIYRKYTPPSLDNMQARDRQYNLQIPVNQLPKLPLSQPKATPTPSLKRRPTIPQYQRQLYQAAFPMPTSQINTSYPITPQHTRSPAIWMQPNQPLFPLNPDHIQMNWASTPANAMNAYRYNNALFENQSSPDLSAAFTSSAFIDSQGLMMPPYDPYSSEHSFLGPDATLDDYMISSTSPNFDQSTDTSPEDLCFDSRKFGTSNDSNGNQDFLVAARKNSNHSQSQSHALLSPSFLTPPGSPSKEDIPSPHPPATTTRRTRRRRQPFSNSSITTPTTPTHHRRKSSSTTTTPSSLRRTPRSKSSFSTSTTPSTPQTPANSSFVNFTPEDSLKILTGVAPSGSSKTKARREREEREKERRMSQIAAKAVRDAGGDVEGLRRAGILVDYMMGR
ncbi:MAG: hypothetical protein MMC33_008722 [Icmadophila ericetorum]|nr:hypothetical protein [Icmadophila ericetorum]